MRTTTVALVLLFPLSAWAQAPNNQPPGTIKVVGEATVNVKPDLAELDVGVVSQAQSAAAAAAENARKMEKIIAALKKEVAAGGEVKTVSYNVGQRYGRPMPGQETPPIVGYTVTNVVRARIPDINAVGRVADLALKQGANDIQRVVFSLKDPEPPHAEALRAAAVKARAHANALAASMGLKLGPVVSLTEGGPAGIPMMEMEAMKVRAAASTPIEAGALEMHATVTAVFAAR
jgi:uncharacterized protein YggE